MPAYAIGHLTNVEIGPGIREYLERIDATLAPFEGRFPIHGARPEVREAGPVLFSCCGRRRTGGSRVAVAGRVCLAVGGVPPGGCLVAG
jgi:Domain of unknown function (DUF1330)